MVAEELYDVLSPLLAAAGLDLYDLQVGQGTVTVTVDRVGGIDLELIDAPHGASRIAAFAIKVEPFDRAKVSKALEALGAKVPGATGSRSAGPFARRAAPLVENPAALAFLDPDGIECELWPA